MAQIFISYSRSDKDFVRQLSDALVAHERKSWADWKDIPLTAEWQQEIFTNIENAESFVFIISPNSVASQNCKNEIAHAVANKKRIAPILYRSVPDDKIPPELAKYQRIDFSGSNDFDSQFSSLINALDTDLPWVQTHTRLLTRAKEWEREGKDKSFLLHGKDLREAERWIAHSTEKDPQPTPLHSQYVLASRQSATRLQRIIIAAVAAAFLIAVALAVYAFVEKNFAQRETQIAEQQRLLAVSRQLATESLTALGSDPTVAFRLAEDAVLVKPTPQAQIALFRVFDRHACFSAATLPGEMVVGHVAFSPDGKRIVTDYRYGTSVWNATTGEHLMDISEDSEYNRAVFSRDGSLILTVSPNQTNTLEIWNAGNGQKERTWNASEITPEVEAEFATLTGFSMTQSDENPKRSPDGSRRILIDHAVAALFDNASGQEICRLEGHQNDITSASFSQDGTALVTGSLDQTARIWRLPRFQPAAGLSAPRKVPPTGSDSVTSVTSITAKLEGTTVRLVNAKGQTLRELIGHTGDIDMAIFSPDGRQLATSCLVSASMGSQDTSVRIWDVESGLQLRQFDGKVQPQVAFSADGQEIIVDGTTSPATWQGVLRAVEHLNARGIPRELRAEERQLYGDDKKEVTH